MSDSVRPHRQQPTRLPRPWDSPGKNTGVGYHFLLQCIKVKSESEVPQLCLILSDPMDCSLLGSFIHRIFQARVLEWSDSVRFILFLYYIVPIFAWNILLISLILLMRLLVFPILLFPSIYLHCSLKKAFLSLLAILWNSAFRWVLSFFFSFAFSISSFLSYL